jgi:uncharacterized protein YbjT (DUF2867 family)
MVVFLTGASGFIGRHVAAALADAGHALILGLHRAPSSGAHGRVIAVDFTRDVDAAAWRPRLAGVDVVINTVGIFREQGTRTFDTLHGNAPRALFAACVDAGVRKVVHLSALGADDEAASAYHVSKRDTDRYLATLPIDSAIVQPSLVYGAGGTSARLFDTLASLPWIPVPGRGQQRVQPVHVDDVADAIVALVAREGEPGTRYPIVGPAPVTLADFLARLRSSLGFGRARIVHVPMRLVRLAADAGSRMPGLLLDREALAMLERGNTAPVDATRSLLGHDPRPIEAFVDSDDAPAASMRAALTWLLPLLRLSIAIVWIWTGIVSLGLYPVEQSYALLARLRIEGVPATIMLYGAALLDVALGVATLALRRRTWLWRAQIALIAGYMVLISIGLPEFWLHPYGPILKNLPLLVAIGLVATLEGRRWTT